MASKDEHSPSSFVTRVDLSLKEKLVADLTHQGFEMSQPLHTVFAAKKKGVSCTLYTSGKLLVQGKEMGPFLEFYLEPEILHSCAFTYPEAETASSLDLTPRIGIDESGKGDFFGPLCVGGVFAEGEQIAALHKLGVKDSKALDDKTLQKMAPRIRELVSWNVVRINPLKYNELYDRFGNLNTLLGWGHATVIENLLKDHAPEKILVDQFADERVVLKALAKKNLHVALTQRHRAEEDVVVAAASILARDAFLQGLKRLSEQFHLDLPKGASAQVIAAGKRLLAESGREALGQVAKLHFKTLDRIVGRVAE